MSVSLIWFKFVGYDVRRITGFFSGLLQLLYKVANSPVYTIPRPIPLYSQRMPLGSTQGKVCDFYIYIPCER